MHLAAWVLFTPLNWFLVHRLVCVFVLLFSCGSMVGNPRKEMGLACPRNGTWHHCSPPCLCGLIFFIHLALQWTALSGCWRDVECHVAWIRWGLARVGCGPWNPWPGPLLSAMCVAFKKNVVSRGGRQTLLQCYKVLAISHKKKKKEEETAQGPGRWKMAPLRVMGKWNWGGSVAMTSGKPSRMVVIWYTPKIMYTFPSKKQASAVELLNQCSEQSHWGWENTETRAPVWWTGKKKA